MSGTRHTAAIGVISRAYHAVIIVGMILCQSIAGGQEPAASSGQAEISLENFRDKVRGGWAGQMIGVSFGFPTEFKYLERIIPENELPVWKPEMVREALNQDDLYVDITLAEVLDRNGLDASPEDFAALFREAKYPLWHANLAARRALRRGVPATLSGTPRYNIHANDIDFQIESDFIGLMSPGLPQESNALSYRAGRVMNHGDGIYGGMFISAMYAAAFFENDAGAIVEAGLAALPAASPYAKVIADVLEWRKQFPADWQHVWGLLNDKWSRNQACPAGAMHAFNIDAKINGAYVAIGLLYGDGDFEKTMLIATRAGQDSDCNPSSVLGILGVVGGYDNIPNKFTSGIDAIADEPFSFTSYSFNDILDSTVKRAILLVERTGGAIEDGIIRVNVQQPEQAALDVWDDYGTATERVEFDDVRWRWSGNWQHQLTKIWRSEYASSISDERGAEARISFDGTGASVTGLLLPDGGQADVYLDGKLSKTIDVFPDERDAKFDESIWHVFGLENKTHALRIVVRGEPFRDSQGSKISIASLIVFE